MKARREELLERLESSLDYWQDLVGLEVLGDVSRLMEAGRMTQADLARRLGSSQPYVSKVLNGNANFTLQTLIKLALALKAVLHVRMALPDEIVQVKALEDVIRALEPKPHETVILAEKFVADLGEEREAAQLLKTSGRLLGACVAEA